MTAEQEAITELVLILRALINRELFSDDKGLRLAQADAHLRILEEAWKPE